LAAAHASPAVQTHSDTQESESWSRIREAVASTSSAFAAPPEQDDQLTLEGEVAEHGRWCDGFVHREE
jgi:hypothetical protein